MSKDSDQIQRFLFDATPVRGEILHLQDSVQAVLACHDYPAGVQSLLGELLAAAALLTETVKLQGRLSLEARASDGQVSLLVAEANTGQSDAVQLRGLAQFQPNLEGEGLMQLMGRGQLIMTLEPRGGQRYQGMVALEQATLAACLEHYFATSEQLPTRIWLEADSQGAAGFLLQQLPGTTDSIDGDAWNRITQLAATLTRQELLTLPAETLLYRLFHEETVKLFDPRSITFACTCSRERTGATLATLSQEEIRDILAEQGQIETCCHFCNRVYRFTEQDMQQFYQLAQLQPTGDQRLQ